MSPVRHFIHIKSLRLHYLEWGDASRPPLVLLHGGAAHAHWWDHIAPRLAQGHHVFALDLRGHGDSSWVVPPAYEIHDYVADLQAFIETLDLAPFSLIGHSLGGFVSLAYAVAQPELLRSLVVIDIRARLGRSRFMRLLQSLPAPVYTDEHDLLRRFRLLPVETHASPELFETIARYSVKRAADGQLLLKSDRAALSRAPRDLSKQLAGLTCPTLFIRGQDSKNLSASALAELLQACPAARGVTIAQAGHHVFLDNPSAFLNAVKIFLDESGEIDIDEGKLR